MNRKNIYAANYFKIFGLFGFIWNKGLFNAPPDHYYQWLDERTSVALSDPITYSELLDLDDFKIRFNFMEENVEKATYYELLTLLSDQGGFGRSLVTIFGMLYGKLYGKQCIKIAFQNLNKKNFKDKDLET